jgi:hypothetical protein
MPLIDTVQTANIFLENTYVFETCIYRCTFSMTEDHLDLLKLEFGRIQGGEFLRTVWGSGREGGHRRQSYWRGGRFV